MILLQRYNYLKNTVLILYFVIVNYSIFSQNNNLEINKYSFDIKIGPSVFYGDIKEYNYSPSDNYNKTHLAYYIGLNRNINDFLYLGTNFSTTSFSGFSKTLNQYFNADISVLSIKSGVLLNDFLQIKSEKIGLFTETGIGLMFFRTLNKKYTNNSYINSYGYRNNGDKKSNKTVSIIYPISIGLNYKISNRFSIGYVFEYNFTNTDRLDAKIINNSKNDSYLCNLISFSCKLGKVEKNHQKFEIPVLDTSKINIIAENNEKQVNYIVDTLKIKHDDLKIINNIIDECSNCCDLNKINYNDSNNTSDKYKRNSSAYYVNNFNEINSNGNDISPSYVDKQANSIIFSSSRDTVNGMLYDDRTKQNLLDIFVEKKDNRKKWIEPIPYEKPLNSKETEGWSYFNYKTNNLFFTRCNIITNKNICKIYVTRKRGNNWDIPVLIPLVTDSFSAAHPFVNEKETELYFTSDMPGGYGGKDIWLAKRNKKSKKYDKPQNLGNIINTDKDESFPFMREDSVLFFSSNGHEGLGGMDIFKTKYVNGKWLKPKNLKYPINSENDDISIIFEYKKEKGMFSSNRNGGKGGYDIYNFQSKPYYFNLKGTIIDDSTDNILSNVDIKLINDDSAKIVAKSNPNGVFMFDSTKILRNKNYKIVLSKKHFYSKAVIISTIDYDNSHYFNLLCRLKPKPEKIFVFDDIYYDTEKWEIKKQYFPMLDSIVSLLNQYKELKIEVSSFTDTRATLNFNIELSKKRSESVYEYFISKGLTENRIINKWYGDTIPKIIDKNIIFEGLILKKGDVLNDDFINNLKTIEEKNAAYQLNRRSEFKLIKPKDFKILED